MLHVFVETNFIVDALRPLASPDAKYLRERARRGELRLYIPWCSFPEASQRHGEADLYFCNLNKNDFQAGEGTLLDLAYRDAGLRYLDTFKVPE